LLKLVPKPAAKKTLLATFRKWMPPRKWSRQLSAKIIPCTLEFLDKITIRCVEEYARVGLPLDVEAVLLMETDGHPAVVQEEAQQMAEIARRHGAAAVQVAQTSEEATRLSTARRVAFSALARVSSTTILERHRTQERAGQHGRHPIYLSATFERSPHITNSLRIRIKEVWASNPR
jgi:glycolate oxidase